MQRTDQTADMPDVPRSSSYAPRKLRLSTIATLAANARRISNARSQPVGIRPPGTAYRTTYRSGGRRRGACGDDGPSDPAPPPARLLAELPERHPTDAEEYHGEVVPYYPNPLREPMRTCCTAQWRKWRCEIFPQRHRIWQMKRPGAAVNSEFYMVLGDAWQATGSPGGRRRV
jgi:hypothetical protein